MTTTTRLPNLTPHRADAGLVWRCFGFDARIMCNDRGQFYRSSTSGSFGTGAGVMPGTMFPDNYQHSRTLRDFKLQSTMNRTYSSYFAWYNLTNDWTNNNFIHAFGREIPSYASGAGTNLKAGVTARLIHRAGAESTRHHPPARAVRPAQPGGFETAPAFLAAIEASSSSIVRMNSLPISMP